MSYRLKNLKSKTKISKDSTFVDWLSFCREICINYFIKNSVMLGGPNEIMQIDKQQLLKEKITGVEILNPMGFWWISKKTLVYGESG